MKIRGAKDFYGGLLFIFFGLLALTISRDYPVGSNMNMGPGYFPTVVGILLVLLGLFIALKGLIKPGEGVKTWVPRPLVMVLAAAVAFALMVQPFGLVAATLVLVTLSCYGGPEFRLRDMVVLSLLLAALTVVLFIYGVKLPLKVWPV